MPRLNIKNTEKKEETVEVIAKTEREGGASDLSQGASNKVTLACHLMTAVKFDQIPDDNGGTKTIIIPGINDNLRGNSAGGILLGVGNSIAVTLSASDWENMKRLYGNMSFFKPQNGLPPCIMELKGGKDEFENSDAVKVQTAGTEPVEQDKIVRKTSK